MRSSNERSLLLRGRKDRCTPRWMMSSDNQKHVGNGLNEALI